ncbi:MAG: hypothetical protein ACRD38_12920 [Nitrososphaerales archaeon]
MKGTHKGTQSKRERSVVLTKHEIHLLNSSLPIPPKQKYKLFLKLERISKQLLNDLFVIMHSRHLKKWNADHEFWWRRTNANIHRFVGILPAYNLEHVTVYRFKIRYKKIGNERYYWKQRDNSLFSESMEKPTYPIVGIKGGYVRRVLRAAIERDIGIPDHESNAVTLSEIRRRLRSRTNVL